MIPFVTDLETPLGTLRLAKRDGALTALSFAQAGRASMEGVRDDARFAVERNELTEYFAGRRIHFDFPIAPEGTPFQKRVWKELLAIPFGATVSYGAIARKLGDPRSSRAVGAANGKNPIAIVVPCHRVIGADGSLTGYAFGNERKGWLLELERRMSPRASALVSAHTA